MTSIFDLIVISILVILTLTSADQFITVDLGVIKYLIAPKQLLLGNYFMTYYTTWKKYRGPDLWNLNGVYFHTNCNIGPLEARLQNPSAV